MKLFVPGELVLLLFIKIPCAIDYLVQALPHHRTLSHWQNAVGKAKGHFHASRTHDNIDKMHPVYRQHKHASTLPLESSSGLVYMHTQLLSYTAAQFEGHFEVRSKIKKKFWKQARGFLDGYLDFGAFGGCHTPVGVFRTSDN